MFIDFPKQNNIQHFKGQSPLKKNKRNKNKNKKGNKTRQDKNKNKNKPTTNQLGSQKWSFIQESDSGITICKTKFT